MVLEGINGTRNKVNFTESPRTSSTQLPGPLPTAARWSVFQLASGVQTSSVQGTLVLPGLLRQPPSRKARRSPPRLSLTYSVTDANSFRSPPSHPTALPGGPLSTLSETQDGSQNSSMLPNLAEAAAESYSLYL